ncbi:MAG TPA: hypothetical protein VHL31_01175, partial [Geminicoccus sp.]
MARAWLIGTALAMLAGLTSAADAQSARMDLTAAQLRDGTILKLHDNQAFLPPDGARAPLEPFSGTLRLSEVEMTTEKIFKVRQVLGKDPKIFPSVALSFFTEGSDLVPLTQDVIRAGSTAQGRSYWDIIVQPGRVWSEPGDDGWSRASFPFALMHSLEGETHNGVATFLYKGSEVTGLQFQVIQQTSPYYIEDYFTAWGRAPASFTELGETETSLPRERYRQALAHQVEIRPW